MSMEKKIVYQRPSRPCWIKIMDSLSDGKYGIEEGEIYKVAQVLWDFDKAICPVKIKSPATGELVGLLAHEFSYCDEDGQLLS
jgi:hypothetical protein